MPTQPKGYFLRNGERVPSVTQIISRFKDSGGLIHWAWRQGRDGKDYRQVRDEAADAGTMAHAAVDAWIHGRIFAFDGPSEIATKAQTAFAAFLDWVEQTKLKIVRSELPLVSERYRYGGTFDAVVVGNQPAICDWKTSNKCYGEYLVQIAAYAQLWQENFPDEPLTGGFHLLRFDKNFGDFHHHFWRELDDGWTAFQHLRALYDLSARLNQRAA